MILQLACSLLIFSSLEYAVNGQCSTPPVNQAVLEGTPNRAFSCNSPTKVSYSVVPTSDELDRFNITFYDDIVASSLTNLYGVNQSHLLIKTCQSTAAVQPISTSGLYVVYINGTAKHGAKLIVVRSGPTCTCSLVNTTHVQLSSSTTFIDSSFNPISANLTWRANGVYYSSTIPARARTNTVTVTSSIFIDAYDQSNYRLNITFTEPNGIQLPYISTNAPDFTASCTAPFCGFTTTPTTTTTTPTPAVPLTTVPQGQCLTPPVNQAVLEGTPNRAFSCNSPTKVSWSVVPTSDELDRYNITFYDDIVASSLTNLYGVNQSHLLVRTGQSTAAVQPISTSGLYVVYINGTAKYGAKLIVVRQGPTCTCSLVNATHVQLSASTIYADSSFNPISANLTWRSNGVYYSSTIPARARTNTVTVTSSIFIDAYDQSNYQLNITFTQPNGIQLPYVSTNAPDFTASCTAPFCGLTTTPTTTTTTPTTTTTTPTTTTPGCNCPPTTPCPTPNNSCTQPSECQSDGTDLTSLNSECVVKAELYVKSDSCCPESLVCGVVVTIRNDSRWLIHDPVCNDNTCGAVAVNATCMTSGWKLVAVRKITASGFGDYISAGKSVELGVNSTDCSDSCKQMMDLP